MHKVCGLKSDFAYMKEDNSRVIIGYGLQETDSLCEWYEVYLYKKHNSQISLDVVKDAIINDINTRITNQIVSGFVWEEKPVWFSLENQINFSQSSAPCSIKIGEYEDGSPVYVDFETKAALNAFNDACLTWKNQCLEAGRAEKENIDWTPYKELFPQDEPVEPRGSWCTDVIAFASCVSVAKETLTLKEKVALLETRVESLEKKIREYELN